MPEREEAQPDAGANDHQDRGQPARREGIGQERGLAPELLAAGDQGQGQEAQPAGLFVITALEQGKK